MNRNLVKKGIIKLLKSSKKQFYKENGDECTVEEYVNILLSQPKSEIYAYQKKVKEMKDEQNN